MGNRIQLVALDIDGCITRGESQPAELKALEALQEYNERSKSDENAPALTLLSGRPGPYVECMLQMIGGYKPALFENGGGLFDPGPYEFHFAPHAPFGMAQRFPRITEYLEEHFVEKGIAKLQPGKCVSWSLYPNPGTTVDDVLKMAAGMCKEEKVELLLETSVMCLNVSFPGMDKGNGLAWLAQRLGLSLKNVAAVGDSVGDAPMLKRAGFAGAPQNAVEEAKKAAKFVSSASYSDGLIEIIETIIENNRLGG